MEFGLIVGSMTISHGPWLICIADGRSFDRTGVFRPSDELSQDTYLKDPTRKRVFNGRAYRGILSGAF